jgi:hypothetical protein
MMDSRNAHDFFFIDKNKKDILKFPFLLYPVEESIGIIKNIYKLYIL